MNATSVMFRQGMWPLADYVSQLVPRTRIQIPYDYIIQSRMLTDEDQDSPERDIVNPPSEDSYVAPFGAH